MRDLYGASMGFLEGGIYIFLYGIYIYISCLCRLHIRDLSSFSIKNSIYGFIRGFCKSLYRGSVKFI